MKKTERQISASLGLVDIIIEILDARCPLSSQNPNIGSLTKGKPRLVLLNKSDLADASVTKQWIEYFKEKGIPALSVNCQKNIGIGGIKEAINNKLYLLIENRKKRGISGMPIRAMVLGIPNVGKSSFINSLSKTSSTKVENRPGVTRGKQWISAFGMEFLDTPGILWHKLDDQTAAQRLAFCAAVKDAVMDTEELAVELVRTLGELYPALLSERYGESTSLEDIAKARSFLVKGGEADTERAANILLAEFRNGKIGRVSLETP
jgi:ribosome biogenesis GTP-binding protein YlqF